MRLLHANSNSGFSLATFYEGNIPPYAILSHTWGPDEDEVTFQDLMSCVGHDKPGWKKLEFCARQVANLGIGYFWIDTCCINKLSDQELSESINSMFRWYQRAAICYVYLSDIPVLDEQGNSSRWFTRGWTLQELLAPRKVDFFTSEGKYLGDKYTIGRVISSITKIPIEALHGKSLQSFSVEERLSWAQHRRTKREEDAAYSMLGIFGVSMPLVYGEGRKWAYHRLLTEVESLGKTRSLTEKYSQYLPSEETPDLEKAIGQASKYVYGKNTCSVSQYPLPDEGTLILTWDPQLQMWIQVEWSLKYQRHFRQQYREGQGWVFLDWLTPNCLPTQ